jgi:hypothetical protein
MAALGLIASFLFPKLVGPIVGTLVGFGTGVLLLALAVTEQKRRPHHVKCPKCGAEVDCGEREPR